MSVIEHGINFLKFAKECSRLLRPNGKLFITFDYWDPKIPRISDWIILDRNDVLFLIDVCASYGLKLNEPIDWTIQDKVINGAYYSSSPEIAYTFGMLVFLKI